MIATLQNLHVNDDGTQSITVRTTEDFRDSYDDLNGRFLDLDIRPHCETRSKNANAYFHALCGEISMETGEAPNDVKRRLIREYGAIAKDEGGFITCYCVPLNDDIDHYCKNSRFYETKIIDGKSYNCYIELKATHTMTRKEMSVLIDGAETEARELGINPNPSLIKIKIIDHTSSTVQNHEAKAN